jgi:hypothetical protein
MANSDKNIVITPNISSTTDYAKIVFSGADASTSAQNITVRAYPTNNGTLSFEGSNGQLLSIANTMSGTIFSANDISGIPSIEVLDTGLVKLAQYSGQVAINTSTAQSGSALTVNGGIYVGGAMTATSIQTQTGAGTIYGAWTLASGATFQATYADLAERYSSDVSYDPGTVVVFRGIAEVTISLHANDRTVAGVVSTNPAYLLNVDIEGVDVALQGRVPCKVIGPIQKGDMMVTSDMPGVAMANNDPKMGTVIGKALEDYASTEVGTIEVAVGRL